MKNKIAKVIRMITVPPVMVAALLTLLFFFDDVFPTPLDFVLALIFLAVLPVLAYPVQMLVPKWREGGRKVQRLLAFIFSFIGYSAAVIVSIVRDAVPNLLYISAVYLVSVILLTLFNCFSPWRASGHACSIAGPILLICLFSGYYAIPAGLLVFAASFWASVYMKRHTVREFLLGALCAGLAGLITYFIVHPVF